MWSRRRTRTLVELLAEAIARTDSLRVPAIDIRDRLYPVMHSHQN
jgi:hypothetical protein